MRGAVGSRRGWICEALALKVTSAPWAMSCLANFSFSTMMASMSRLCSTPSSS